MDAEGVKKLRGLLGLTQEELAQKIGVSRNTIINYEKGGVIPDSKIQLISSLFELAAINAGINKIEIDTQGNVVASDNSGTKYMGKATPIGEKKYSSPSLTKTCKENPTPYETYLLPLSAMGGPLTCFAADGVMLSNCEKIVSPIEDVDFAITIYGESMAPKYPSGTRLLIKKINPAVFIEWGKSYVLDTSNGVVVKEVRVSNKDNCIACYSINPDPKFQPFDVPLSEVYGMYKVLMSLSAE